MTRFLAIRYHLVGMNLLPGPLRPMPANAQNRIGQAATISAACDVLTDGNLEHISPVDSFLIPIRTSIAVLCWCSIQGILRRTGMLLGKPKFMPQVRSRKTTQQSDHCASSACVHCEAFSTIIVFRDQWYCRTTVASSDDPSESCAVLVIPISAVMEGFA